MVLISLCFMVKGIPEFDGEYNIMGACRWIKKCDAASRDKLCFFNASARTCYLRFYYKKQHKLALENLKKLLQNKQDFEYADSYVKIFNRALTKTEIKKLYEEKNNG